MEDYADPVPETDSSIGLSELVAAKIQVRPKIDLGRNNFFFFFGSNTEMSAWIKHVDKGVCGSRYETAKAAREISDPYIILKWNTVAGYGRKTLIRDWQ